MTSPAEEVDVRCPGCGHEWRDWTRASVNLDLDPWADAEYLEECSTATCPECGVRSQIADVLVVDGETWRWR